MENKEITTPIENVPPKGMLVQSRLQRFDKVFFNLSIAASVLVLVALLSSFVTPMLFLFALVVLFGVLLALIVFTAGTAFFMPGNSVGIIWSLISKLVGSGEAMTEFVAFCFNITKWISIVGVVLSAIAIVFMSINKNKQHFVGKIITLSILIALLIFVFVFQVVTGGMQ